MLGREPPWGIASCDRSNPLLDTVQTGETRYLGPAVQLGGRRQGNVDISRCWNSRFPTIAVIRRNSDPTRDISWTNGFFQPPVQEWFVCRILAVMAIMRLYPISCIDSKCANRLASPSCVRPLTPVCHSLESRNNLQRGARSFQSVNPTGVIQWAHQYFRAVVNVISSPVALVGIISDRATSPMDLVLPVALASPHSHPDILFLCRKGEQGSESG